MILRRVELGRFGKWTDRVFEFRRGANLVLGGNEAGKTTLAAAIPAVLFGLPDKEHFVPWGSDGCAAALVWEGRQQFWRLERDLCTDQVALTVWHEGGEVLKSFSGHVETGPPQGEYGELLRELFGLDGAEPLAEVFGLATADSSFPLPQAVLGDQSGKWPDSPPGDQTCDEELLQVRGQLAELEQRWYALRPVAGQLREVEELLALVQEEMATAEVVSPLPEVDSRQTSAPMLAAEEGEALLQRRRQLQEELTALGLPVAKHAELPLLLAEAEALRRELISLQKESVRIREERATRPTPPWKEATAASVLLLLTGMAGSLWLAWGAAGWLGGALLVAIVWLLNSHYRGLHLAEDARLKGQAQALEARREVAQDLLSAMDDRFRALAMSPSSVSLVKVQKSLLRGRELADELCRVEGALSVWQGIAAAEMALSTLSPLTENEVAMVPKAEITEQMARHRLLSLERERLQELTAQRQRIEEEGERLRHHEAQLARQLQGTAADAIPNQAGGAEETHPFVEECARLLTLLGERRPFQVSVSGQGSLLLKEGEGGWRSPAAFGHGAGDLLGLAARLAADGAGQSLLLLDEALVHLERARRAEVFGALERIAMQRQVIVFCREDQLPKRLARERWQVLSLDQEPIIRERDDHAGQLHLL